MAYQLYIASDSFSRKNLLTQAGIPFAVCKHDADETQVDVTRGVQYAVTYLAELKMQHVIMPEGTHEQIVFVLTADTLNEAVTGELLAKPVDIDDAKRMLALSSQGLLVGTGFCVQKRMWQNGSWHVLDTRVGYAQARCVFDVPEQCMDRYLATAPYLKVSGAATVEYGVMFLKEVQGSYSAIIGLPMYEVRQMLEDMGFFS